MFTQDRLRLIFAALFLTLLSPTLVFSAEGEEGEGPLIQLKLERAPLDLVIPAIISPTKLNVIVDSKVGGTTTLKLKNVPWETALDLVLKTNDLAKRRVGNTLVIAPKKTIAQNFDQGLTKTFPLRYAKASDVQTLLTALLGKSTAGEFSVQVEQRLNALVISTTEDMFKRVEDLIKKLDRPVPQVMIDIKVVEVSTNFERTLGFDWSWGAGSQASRGTNGSGDVIQVTEFMRNLDNADQYASPSSGSGAAPFSFGDFYRSNLFFNAVFTALVDTSDSRILSSPRLIAMNGQKASLTIGQELTFSGGTDQQPQSKEAGTIINLTPQINNDGYIVLDITLEKSSAQLGRTGFPTVDKTEIKTILQVQDGEEILVGGIVEERETHAVTKIPFLSNLPFLKHFFTKEQTRPNSKEIVVLITPKIVKQSIATSEFGELVADQGGGIPSTPAFDSKFEKPKEEDPFKGMDDPFAGNDFGDGFDDEFSGL